MSLKIIANLMGYPNEEILFYHQMYYSNDSQPTSTRASSNFVKWAPSLKRTGSASQFHGYLNETLTFPLGVTRVKQNDISMFSSFVKSYDDDYDDDDDEFDSFLAVPTHAADPISMHSMVGMGGMTVGDQYAGAQPNVAFAYAKVCCECMCECVWSRLGLVSFSKKCLKFEIWSENA